MIRRVITLLLIISMQLFATHYDSTIIDIEAKIFPKIAMLEKNIEESDSQYLNLSIIAKKIDLDIAKKFKSKIEAYYPNLLLNKKVVVTIKLLKNLSKWKTDAMIVLYHNPKELQEIAQWANWYHVVTLAYDPSYLEHGLLASIYIGKTTKPYLNNSIIKNYHFIFNAYLLQVSKFTNYGEE